ncbi:10322_t:CDS:2, partial [Dentiscutata heterogama]
MEKVGLSSLSPDCIILHSFEFPIPNFNPKFQATLKSWTRTTISLEITNHSFEEINSILEDEALGPLMQNSCNLVWYMIYSMQQEAVLDHESHQIPWVYLGYYLKKELHDAIFEYSLFSNIKDIGKDRFGFVSSADYDGEKVVLKSLKTREFINEVKQLCALKFHPNVNQFHGITIGTVNNTN